MLAIINERFDSFLGEKVRGLISLHSRKQVQISDSEITKDDDMDDMHGNIR